MDYLILTIKSKFNGYDSIEYLCVNSISRCKNTEGKDVIQFIISGHGKQVLVEDVLCITPSTPTPDQYRVFE